MIRWKRIASEPISMKFVLAGLAAFAASIIFAGPAQAFERAADGPAVVIDVRDRGWDDGDGWRADEGGWRDREDWRERRERWSDRRDRLSENQIARRLMRQGFVRIEDIDRRRDRYVVRAVRPNGALIRLAVDAYDGEVIARERIGWVAGRRGYDRDYRRPANGIEFDLGNGTLGVYSR